MSEIRVENYRIVQDGSWRRVYVNDEYQTCIVPDGVTSAMIKEIIRLREENKQLAERIEAYL